jgi:hypothetical protein
MAAKKAKQREVKQHNANLLWDLLYFGEVRKSIAFLACQAIDVSEVSLAAALCLGAAWPDSSLTEESRGLWVCAARSLLDLRACVNRDSGCGYSPLEIACLHTPIHNSGLVQLLLERGANTAHAFEFAATAGVVKQLLQYGLRPNKRIVHIWARCTFYDGLLTCRKTTIRSRELSRAGGHRLFYQYYHDSREDVARRFWEKIQVVTEHDQTLLIGRALIVPDSNITHGWVQERREACIQTIWNDMLVFCQGIRELSGLILSYVLTATECTTLRLHQNKIVTGSSESCKTLIYDALIHFMSPRNVIA